ncbi:Hypothetical_protein [Hexamita inflata]|uniref:Hypothetical_protein n=1 Tax=Hexamita inflata TaxID=28002 RepID=A0AA86Q6F0_9EUKA|nr:Hypothetical protein HINF_LOCUS40686 [Hexamita inflata]
MFPKNWTDLTWNQYNIHVWMHGSDSGRQSLNLSRCAQIGSRQFGELFLILLLNAFPARVDQIFELFCQKQIKLQQVICVLKRIQEQNNFIMITVNRLAAIQILIVVTSCLYSHKQLTISIALSLSNSELDTFYLFLSLFLIAFLTIIDLVVNRNLQSKVRYTRYKCIHV